MWINVKTVIAQRLLKVRDVFPIWKRKHMLQQQRKITNVRYTLSHRKKLQGNSKLQIIFPISFEKYLFGVRKCSWKGNKHQTHEPQWWLRIEYSNAIDTWMVVRFFLFSLFFVHVLFIFSSFPALSSWAPIIHSLQRMWVFDKDDFFFFYGMKSFLIKNVADFLRAFTFFSIVNLIYYYCR